MKKRTQFLRVVVMALIVIGLGSHGYAQSNRGTISGSIVDINGASIADAKVIATNTETRVVTETVSTGEGNYRLPELPPGTYTLSVTAPNFKTGERTEVRVEINTVAALDIVLEAGAISDVVTVVADAPTVQSESSSVGTVVRPRQVLELPLRVNGVTGLRSPEAFAFLVPGVVGPGTATDAGANTDGPNENGGAFQSKITGSQNFANEVLLEGASVFRSENGSSFDETAPSVEALTEFKVQTSTLPAEFGRTGGGITSFVIRSGTNDFHGNLYDFIRQRVLNANRFFNNSRGRDPLTGNELVPRPLDNFHNFGGTIGGPIFLPRFGEGGPSLYNGRDRSFFFFAYEGFRRTTGGAQFATLPTAAFLRGDFSSLLGGPLDGVTDALGRPVLQGQIYDPATQRTVNGQVVRDPFPGNIIPQSRFSQVARNVLGFIPSPNLSGRFNNNIFSFSAPTTVDAYTIKLDHALSDRSKLSGSFSQRTNFRGAVATVRLPFPIDPEAREQNFRTRYLRIAHDHTFSSSLLNYFSIGLNRTVSLNRSVAAGQNFPSQLGITGVGPNLFPRIAFGGGITDIGGEQFNDNIDNGIRINDNVSYIAGQHSIKFGGDFRYQQYTPSNQGGTSGRFFFGENQTAAVVNNSARGNTGFGFASFLLGQVGGANLNVSPNIIQWRSNYYAAFVQDDWKVSKNLLLNLGLRYEIDTPRRELYDRHSSFDPTLPNPGADGRLGALAFAGDGPGRIGRRSFANSYKRAFGPRLGFAYSPDRTDGFFGKLLGGAGKTVFRGGYGIYYQALVYADFGERLVSGFAGTSDALRPSNNYDPSFNIDRGFPQNNLPNLPFIDPTLRNLQDVEYVAREDGAQPRIQNYSFEVQRELAADLILSVGYVGAHGDRLRSSLRRLNTVSPEFLRFGELLNQPFNSPAVQAAIAGTGITRPYPSFPGNENLAQALRPFPQYRNINTDCCLENEGTMDYNSLQMKLERRFRNGLNLLTAYTFSKTLTDSDSALPVFATFSGGGEGQNPYDRRGDRSLSNQDIPHALVISYIYELPIGAGRRFDTGNGVLNKLVGGFQIGGVHRYQSGQPISIGCAPGLPGNLGYGCIRFNRVEGQPLLSEAVRNGTFDPNAPDYRANPALSATENLRLAAQARNIYLNPLAFADPNAVRGNNVPFRFGNFPRTTGEVRSPRFYNEDLSILKKTPITETVTLEFRTEIFNIFNRVILRRPNPNGALDPNSDFGEIFGQSNNPRAIQFGLKLLF